MPHLRYLFRHNYGSCIDIAAFAVYCLKKGGYNAWELRVPSPTGRAFHLVCVFEVNGKKYVIDHGCPNPLGIIPFTAYGAYFSIGIDKIGWARTLGIIAVIFNPILPIYLNRDIWAIIDVGVGFILLLSLFSLRKPKN